MAYHTVTPSIQSVLTTNHPFTIPLFQILICASAATLIPPMSKVRYTAVLVVAILVASFHTSSHAHFQNLSWNAFCGCLTVGIALVATERLLVSRWCLRAAGPTLHRLGENGERGGEEVGGAQGKLRRFITDLVFSPRGVGRSWAVSGIPPFSRTDLTYTPTRSVFLRHRLSSTLISFLLLDILSSLPPPPDSEVLFGPARIAYFGRFSEVTLGEFGLRLTSTIGFWVSTYCIINIIHGTFAVFAVGLGGSEPGAWPPIFGHLSEAYSIRRFWK